MYYCLYINTFFFLNSLNFNFTFYECICACFCLPGTGANLFWQEASALQLPGFVAKPACTHHQGHSEAGETLHKAEEMTKKLVTEHKTD